MIDEDLSLKTEKKGIKDWETLSSLFMQIQNKLKIILVFY